MLLAKMGSRKPNYLNSFGQSKKHPVKIKNHLAKRKRLKG
jgi:hypothetical protein